MALLPADEVSAVLAQLFGSHGQQFQALAARAAAFHEQFVSLMNSGADAYLGTEVANAAQTLAGRDCAGPVGRKRSSGIGQQVGSAVAALRGGGTVSAGTVPTGFQAAALGTGGCRG